MNKKTITLLFLSGGSQVTQFLMTTLVGRRADMRLIATSSIADDAGLFGFDAVYLAPKTAKDPVGFERLMEKIITNEGIDLIVPARDDDVAFLGAWRDRNPDRSHMAAVGPGHIARMACDKWLSHEYAVAHGLPFARSLHEANPSSIRAFIDEVGFPVLAKPRDGFSSKGIFLLDSMKQIERWLAVGNYVIEEYLGPADDVQKFREGLEHDGVPLFYMFHGRPRFSAELIIGPSGDLVGEFCSDNEPQWRSRYVEHCKDEDGAALMRQCAQVFIRDGWRGPFNIQAQRDRKGVLRIHEFNGRLTAPTAERYFMGHDGFAKLVEAFTGFELPPSPWNTHPAPRANSQLCSRAADPRQVERLLSEGHWKAGV
ncbi:hypothetical protein [Rhodoferax sp.]|uniref:hypothetical protein n=1 Tax=Rhodoferax sp. TaxID=50421 RepID=UPI0026322777|nr:hypothetical protein [Rhodoferax sp.]MDD2919869.1 hypothetical protein [Rhodoferax sp.]